MNIKVLLTGKNWTKKTRSNYIIFFIGYMEYKDKIILNADDLNEIFVNKIESDDIQEFIENEFLPHCNGNYAFVIHLETNLIATTDYIRSYPIHLIKVDQEYTIADHMPSSILDRLNINNENCEEFLMSGYVLGNNTVFDDFISLQPAEIINISDDHYNIKKYFILNTDPLRKETVNENKSIYEKMDRLFLTTFKRMIKTNPNVRKWVIPLSGGHDSRLIINYLFRLGCKNVICFTYGNENSKEVEISRLAAEALKFEWHFIDYFNNEQAKLHDNNLLNEYISYSFNGCNLPNVLDLLAIKKLKDNGIITEEDVIVPGHTAFTESESNEVFKFKKVGDAIDYVFSTHYNLYEPKNKILIKNRLKILFNNSNQTPESFPDFFNWHERQVKYIGNCVRAYEFFGLSWHMPFWEKEIISFWQSIDYKDRIGRKILMAASKEKLFVKELLAVPIIDKFSKPKNVSKFKKIPLGLRSFIARFITWNPKVVMGTNQVFMSQGNSIKEIIKPLNVYPNNIKRYFIHYLSRRPNQMNPKSLMAIYTLKNEVFLRNQKKQLLD